MGGVRGGVRHRAAPRLTGEVPPDDAGTFTREASRLFLEQLNCTRLFESRCRFPALSDRFGPAPLSLSSDFGDERADPSYQCPAGHPCHPRRPARPERRRLRDQAPAPAGRAGAAHQEGLSGRAFRGKRMKAGGRGLRAGATASAALPRTDCDRLLPSRFRGRERVLRAIERCKVKLLCSDLHSKNDFDCQGVSPDHEGHSREA